MCKISNVDIEDFEKRNPCEEQHFSVSFACLNQLREFFNEAFV